MHIEQLQEHHIEAARAVIRQGCFEFFGQAPLEFDDMERVAEHYTPPSGAFLVLLDNETVVGTGAICRIDGRTCELRRMWILPPYRGQGHGRHMAELLFDFARQAGHQRVWLETAPELHDAVRLYHRLGFEPIDRYREGPCTTFMEKRL